MPTTKMMTLEDALLQLKHNYTYCEGSQSSPDCFIIALSLSSSDASAFAKSVI